MHACVQVGRTKIIKVHSALYVHNATNLRMGFLLHMPSQQLARQVCSVYTLEYTISYCHCLAPQLLVACGRCTSKLLCRLAAHTWHIC